MTRSKKKNYNASPTDLPTPKINVFGVPDQAGTQNGKPGGNTGEDNVWTTEKVNLILEKADEEGLDFRKIPNPFFDANPEFKAPNIIWEYTQEELDEIKKCASDAVYFSRYCQVMTDEGLAYIRLRDYQEDIIRSYQNNRFAIFLAPRQIGKCFLRTSYVTDKSLNKKRLSSLIPRKFSFLGAIKSFLFRIYSLL